MDFGCGGGIDVILAARKVGKEGRVIGVDFAPQMIERAKKAVIDSGLQQWDIELRVADMGESQLPGGCADVVISNCVINLCPEKDTVYEEVFRILKHGGRLAISDIVLIENIDSQLQKRFQSTWPGCYGGAILGLYPYNSLTLSLLSSIPFFSVIYLGIFNKVLDSQLSNC